MSSSSTDPADHSSVSEVSKQAEEHTVTEDQTSDFKPGPRLYIAFSGLLVMTLMVALDGTTISVALPTITRSLRGSSVEAFWTGTAYTLSSTVLQPVYASFSYAFGRKSMILVAITSFGIGAVLCGVSHNFLVMLLGRSIQGVGGAGITAMSEVVLTDLIPLKKRGAYTGVLGSVFALGNGAGPIIGGVFAQTEWRWIFWINLPLVGIALVLVWLFLTLHFKSLGVLAQLKKVDWIGAILFVGSTTTFLIPITWGGVQEPWSSWRTLVPLCVGLVGIFVFYLFESRCVKEPLIPRDVFPNRSANIGYVNSALQGLLGFALIYFLPLYLEGIKEFSPLKTGVAMLPFTAGVAPTAMVVGILITKRASYVWSIWLSWLVCVLGLGLLLLLKVDTSIPAWVFLTMVGALGIGIGAPAIQFQVQASQENQKTVGLALSIYSFARLMGQTFGIALGGVMFSNQLQSKLKALPAFASQASTLGREATGLVQVIQSMPEGPNKQALQTAYVESFKVIWIFGTVISVVGLLSTWFIKAYPVDVKMETDQGFVEKEQSQQSMTEKGGQS